MMVSVNGAMRFVVFLLLAAVSGIAFPREMVKLERLVVMIAKDYEPGQIPTDVLLPIYGQKISVATIPIESGLFEVPLPKELKGWECFVRTKKEAVLATVNLNAETECFLVNQPYGVASYGHLQLTKETEFNFLLGQDVVMLRRQHFLKNIDRQNMKPGKNHKEEIHMTIYGIYK